MVVFINSNNEIKDVNFTEDSTLIPIKVDDDTFKGWNTAKICCHKLDLENGEYRGFTPYVDTRIIEHIERLAKKAEAMSEENAMLSETLDSLITDIIPSLMMG